MDELYNALTAYLAEHGVASINYTNNGQQHLQTSNNLKVTINIEIADHINVEIENIEDAAKAITNWSSI